MCLDMIRIKPSSRVIAHEGAKLTATFFSPLVTVSTKRQRSKVQAEHPLIPEEEADNSHCEHLR